jgi:hypothetical protein
MAFRLHFKDDGTKITKVLLFCVTLLCYILYFPFTFPQTSKCFLKNGTKNMLILASWPELQAVRFGYVILGEN